MFILAHIHGIRVLIVLLRADHIPAPKAFQGSRLRLYETLTTAESSAICQARTEKIGLQAFLYRRKVPGVTTPARS